jgi:hypothetical protein
VENTAEIGELLLATSSLEYNTIDISWTTGKLTLKKLYLKCIKYIERSVNGLSGCDKKIEIMWVVGVNA